MEKFRITLNSICILIVAIIATISFFWSIPEKNKSGTYNTAEEYIKELQVSYQGVKSDLVDAVQHYIDSVSPNSGLRALPLIENCEKYEIPIIFTLAQAEIESHFGTTGLAYRTNSVWNVGAYSDYSFEDIKHRYKNPNDCIDTYIQLLVNNYLQNKTIEDLLDSFVDVNGNRYATDKYYEVKLRTVYDYIQQHYNIDELQLKLKYYKMRL